MKFITMSSVIMFMLGSIAELPPSVEDVLYTITGGTNYIKWMTRDGTIIFHKPFVIFDRAQFRVHCPTNDLSPMHYSIEMKREFANVSSSANIVDYMHEAECLLLRSFKGQTFTRKYDGVHYQSSCADIDGLGWDVCFLVMPLSKTGKTSYVSKAVFYNPLHREGRFISCEDFKDIGKTSLSAQETLDYCKQGSKKNVPSVREKPELDR